MGYKLLCLMSLIVAGVAMCGCLAERLTVAEALEAVEEVSLATQANTLMSSSVEIATDFTIGQAVEQAAQELQDFILSQLPCAEVTLVGATLSIEYGVYVGNCSYKGHTYTGGHTITIESIDSGVAVVHHQWTDLSDGLVRVTGEATVTWDFVAQQRQVEHSLTWTRLIDGRSSTGTGDRLQRPLSEGLGVGFQEDGTRDWVSNEVDEWSLDIDALQMRWDDPVPQDGSLTLDTPFDKTVTFEFARVDEDTIQVTVEGERGSYSFDVSKLGSIEQSE